MTALIAIISGTFASTTPIALAGMGGIFGERAGITNIGLEGTMLFSAFFAALCSYAMQNPWLGLLAGIGTGLLVSLLHAFLCIKVRINHNVSGLAINILASNITIYLMSLYFGGKGTTPAVPKLPGVTVPGLSDIPEFGSIFTNISMITLLVPVVCLLAYYLLNKTDFGLHVIASGENPAAAHSLGIHVRRTQYAAVLIGGLCCGLAGAFLSISYLGMFIKDMTASRGFIAIATILVGRYKPGGVLLAGLLFGFAESLQIALQGIIDIPIEIIQCIPYVLTILVVVGSAISDRKRKIKVAAAL